MITALPILPIAALSQYLFGPLLFVLSLFMILLILVQRGKGGGLTGALGGPGGQSVFGSKAGDLFTRITVVVAAVWIFLLAFAVWWYNEDSLSSALAGTEDDIPTVTVDIGSGGMTPVGPSLGETSIGDAGSGETMSAAPIDGETAAAPSVAPATTSPAASAEPVPETPTVETPPTTPASETPAAEMKDKPAEPASEAPPEPAAESGPNTEAPAESAPGPEAPASVEAPVVEAPSEPAK